MTLLWPLYSNYYSTITCETESACDISGFIGGTSSSNTQLTIKDYISNGQVNYNIDNNCFIGGIIGYNNGELQSINNVNNANVTGNSN